MEKRIVSKIEREEIEKYLLLDEDLILSLIPQYLNDQTSFSSIGQIEAGKKKFKEIEELLYQKICIEWKFYEHLDNQDFQDKVSFIASLGDVITTLAVGIPPFIISTLIVKIGIRKFCRRDDLEHSN